MMNASETETPFVLRAEGLRKSFAGVEVLHGVDLEAHGGRVLALLGENGAGKSTAIKILAGDYRRDAGAIYVGGEQVDIDTPSQAEAVGVKVIFQEFMDAPELTVVENIALGHLPSRFGVVRWAEARRKAEAILDELGVEIPLNARVGALGVAERQILEIARALDADARLLILDEPTSALAAEEVEALFRFIRRLRERGVAIIYITHRLDEVEAIADDVIVFRDGDVVASGLAADFSTHELVEAMVGQRLQNELEEVAKEAEHEGERTVLPTLELAGASLPGLIEGVDLVVAPGEVVALFGRLGCGAVELAEAIFGLHPLGGTVTIAGKVGQPASPAEAIARGVGFVPVDRKTQGILQGQSLSENISVASWGQRMLFSILRPSAIAKAYARWEDRLNISAMQGSGQAIETLSGGNQQKVVLGRWLEHESKLLILAEPTRGVDVGARAEIYHVLRGLAEQGLAVLIVSSDMDEVLRISNRAVVLSRGRVTAVFERHELDRAALAHAASMKEGAS